jgi:hypothetical protein
MAHKSVIIAAVAMGHIFLSFAAIDFAPPLFGCGVKGNISATGERIYHTPGQQYYSKTRINLLKGERWFCSEAAASAAGWRKARI